MKSQGVVGGDGDEVGRCRFEEDAEAEPRRNEGGGGRKVELGEDAFILPTGNYPNNTCISSTPVAHRLSSEGNRGWGMSREWARPEGWRGWAKGREKYNKLRPRAQKQRDNSGIGGLCDTPKAKRKAILIPFSISRSPRGIAIRSPTIPLLLFPLYSSRVFSTPTISVLHDTAITLLRVPLWNYIYRELTRLKRLR